ncbi:benzoate/H(+) symporter BenE family transporter [Acidocella sp. KAb 2-4]|uniref:benzoate/H(+) symporter BenE family transporter n=1 Tax=Acidocella sp. KAb 2-4 TaxID=2885158 RepID=UPI001D07D037|nr:benzoate/H(+) symporter BenE family transporter [Acidocella sp. KAb 2-4]MCB5943615.1 benzoate/H(+) symporter BenE family transporter [Acidocella sp. KAb 2-4]
MFLSRIERPAAPPPGLAQLRADFGATYVAHGFIGWLFAATGPVAIILTVGLHGGLNEAELSSWIFGVFFVNGLITTLFSWIYSRPLAFFWTIPGTVLVGPALGHLSFPEVIGAFYATGLLTILLGATGWVKRLMQAMPLPIVMGMVAGVFLRFGLDLVHAVRNDILLAGPMVAAWIFLTAFRRIGEYIPPIIGALVTGGVAAMLLGRFDLSGLSGFTLAHPVFQQPAWSWPAMVELVIPLAITVLVVQNGQGFAVLKAAGHEAPVDAVTFACGIGAVASAAVGAVSTCLAGPTNAILVSTGEPRRHYTAGITTGLLSIGFGLLAPGFTRFMLAAPKSFIATLAGLAMLRVLQNSFVAAFKTRFTLGALVTFLVTVSDISLFNIGAAFWGLIAGVVVSWLLEQPDFQALIAEQRG